MENIILQETEDYEKETEDEEETRSEMKKELSTGSKLKNLQCSVWCTGNHLHNGRRNLRCIILLFIGTCQGPFIFEYEDTRSLGALRAPTSSLQPFGPL